GRGENCHLLRGHPLGASRFVRIFGERGEGPQRRAPSFVAQGCQARVREQVAQTNPHPRSSSCACPRRNGSDESLRGRRGTLRCRRDIGEGGSCSRSTLLKSSSCRRSRGGSIASSRSSSIISPTGPSR